MRTFVHKMPQLNFISFSYIAAIQLFCIGWFLSARSVILTTLASPVNSFDECAKI